MKKFSIIIPSYNESTNIKNLIEEIFFNLKDYKGDFELIIIDDASIDNTKEVIKGIKPQFKVSLISNDKNLGQSYSIIRGVKESIFETIITLDADGQNNPKDMPKLLDFYFENNEYDLVAGIRKKRKDNLIKIISSRVANIIRSFILNDKCKDTGCSLKVFDKKIFLSFPFFTGLHRFLPALFSGYGKKTYFIEVDHRPRYSGNSNYSTLNRLFVGIRDLIRVWLIINNYKGK